MTDRFCPSCRADLVGNDPHAPDCTLERHRELGARVRVLLTPGDRVIAEHFGSVRELLFVRATSTRALFRWTAPSLGKTRDLWLTDQELGRRLEAAGNQPIVCGDGTLPAGG